MRYVGGVTLRLFSALRYYKVTAAFDCMLRYALLGCTVFCLVALLCVGLYFVILRFCAACFVSIYL